MKNTRQPNTPSDGGFTLIELMIATLLFTTIAGITFTLLLVSLQRYKGETDYLNSFQQANVAMDQIARDVHSAGYPPTNSFTTVTAAANPTLVAKPFAWMPAYPAVPCTVGATCTSPTGFDLLTEADLGTGNGVQWVRYSLQGTTLMRGVANKVGVDPVSATAGTLVPYLENVMNNATAAQIATLKATYPALFPGNAPVPIFTYTYDNGAAIQPPNIREVNITLIVQSARPDPNTNRYRAVVLTGRAARINPNQ
jgi:prepilin-type N-terminal cleavage/methylation domain-containing protein